MSATLDYGCERFLVKEPSKRKKSKKGNRRRRINQFFQDFPNCYYCGVQLTRANRSLDHWVPKSLGGTSRLVNLVTACKTCNVRKGNHYPKDMEVSTAATKTVKLGNYFLAIVSPVVKWYHSWL